MHFNNQQLTGLNYKLKMLLILLLCSGFYEANSQDEYFPDEIGSSNAENSNVNHKRGAFLQDLKRSVGRFIREDNNEEYDSRYVKCSCNLVNTVKQDGTPYIFTAAHCLEGLSVGPDFEGFFTFDFEMSDADNRGDSNTDRLISGMWKAKYNIVFINTQTDVALLKLRPNTYKLELLKNAYAAGWDNTLDNMLYENISHPNGDHKKIFIEPEYSFLESNNNKFTDLDLSGIYYTAFSRWDKVDTHPQDGSSGSGVFSESGHLIGVYIEGYPSNKFTESNIDVSHASALVNNWKTKDTEKDLATFLDSDGSFLNRIPGGYLNDLINVNEDTDFSFTIDQNGRFETASFMNNDDPRELHGDIRHIRASTYFEPTPFADNVADWTKVNGIKIAGNLIPASSIVLTVWYPDLDKTTGLYDLRLLYGSFVGSQTDMSSNQYFEFVEDYWDCDEPGNFPDCNRIPESPYQCCSWMALKSSGQSDVMQNRILKRIKKLARDEEKVMNIHDKLPVVVRLENLDDEPVKVTALSYPGEVSLSALQLFRPNEVKNAFNYYKYKESRGKATTEGEGANTNQYFINSIKIEFEQYVYLGKGNDCHHVGKKTLKEISTGNNGGYLNLINYLHSIPDVVASQQGCPKNKLIITLNRSTDDDADSDSNDEVYYGAWLDYDRAQIGGGQLNPDDNFTYDFKINPSSDAPSEQLKVDKAETAPITIEHEVPLESVLNFNPENNDPIKRILRLAIAKNPQTGNQLTSDGIYDLGEVEDYWVNIRKTNQMDRIIARTSTTKVNIGRGLIWDRIRRVFVMESSSVATSNALEESNSNPNDGISYTQNALLLRQYPLVKQILETNPNNKVPGFLSVMLTFFENLGTAIGVYNGLMQPIENIEDQRFLTLSTDPITDPQGDNSIVKSNHLNPPFDATNPLHPESPNNNENPANANNPLGLNIPLSAPSNPSDEDLLNTPEDVKLFFKVYDSMARLAGELYNSGLFSEYALNFYVHVPPEYWALYQTLKTIIQTSAQGYAHRELIINLRDKIQEAGLLGALKDPQFIKARLSQFLELNPSIIVNTFPEGERERVRKILRLLYSFFVFERNLPWNIKEEGLNLIQNKAKIALDCFGRVIPKPHKERTIGSTLKLKKYPDNLNELAVVFNAKGSDNEVVIGIDHEGYLLYRVKIGTAAWEEVSSKANKVPLKQEVSLYSVFHEGNITLFINGKPSGSGQISINEFPEFSNFSAIGNGARWGGPVDDFSSLPVDPNDLILVPIEAIFYGFDLDDDIWDIEGLFDNPESGTINGKVAGTGHRKVNTTSTNTKNAEAHTAPNLSDFSIFPNPVKTELNILVEVQQAGSFYIGIYDLSGKRVYETKEPHINAGHQLITLRNLKFSAGQYVVKIKAGDVTKSEQVVFE